MGNEGPGDRHDPSDALNESFIHERLQIELATGAEAKPPLGYILPKPNEDIFMRGRDRYVVASVVPFSKGGPDGQITLRRLRDPEHDEQRTVTLPLKSFLEGLAMAAENPHASWRRVSKLE